MTDIKIDKPISINMEIVETDDYLPSIRVLIKCRIEHPTGYFVYQADDIWLDCAKWDEFVESLSRLEGIKDAEACLTDMSEHLEIKIVKNTNELEFIFNCKETIVGKGIANISFSSQIDFDLFGLIKREFGEFPKWW